MALNRGMHDTVKFGVWAIALCRGPTALSSMCSSAAPFDLDGLMTLAKVLWAILRAMLRSIAAWWHFVHVVLRDIRVLVEFKVLVMLVILYTGIYWHELARTGGFMVWVCLAAFGRLGHRGQHVALGAGTLNIRVLRVAGALFSLATTAWQPQWSNLSRERLGLLGLLGRLLLCRELLQWMLVLLLTARSMLEGNILELKTIGMFLVRTRRTSLAILRGAGLLKSLGRTVLMIR